MSEEEKDQRKTLHWLRIIDAEGRVVTEYPLTKEEDGHDVRDPLTVLLLFKDLVERLDNLDDIGATHRVDLESTDDEDSSLRYCRAYESASYVDFEAEQENETKHPRGSAQCPVCKTVHLDGDHASWCCDGEREQDEDMNDE